MNAAAAFIKETRHHVSSHSLFCLIRIAKDFFSNDPFSCLIQILIQYLLNLKVFGPECLVDERLRRLNYNRRAALARVPIRFEPVAAAERGEQAPVPLIDELEVGFYRLFDLLCGSSAFRTRSIAAAAASRSPAVVAPSNSAEILRNFWRSSCSVVIDIVISSKAGVAIRA